MIHVRNIDFGYTEKLLLRELSLHVKEGEVLTIVGPNGSGKSTVLKQIAKLLNPSGGDITIDGKALHTYSAKEFSRTVATLSQHHHAPADFTVEDLIRYGRTPHLSWFERVGKEDQQIIDHVIDKLGLEAYRDRPVAMLSGGERQRAWIGMALAQRPKVLLLDEPTTFLDICHQLEILDIVKSLNETLGLTVIMVLHDLNQACQYSDRVCVMKDGQIIEVGCPNQVICPRIIEEVYQVHADVELCNQTGCMHIRPLRVKKKEHA